MEIKAAVERLQNRAKANAFIINTQCFVQRDIEAIETVLVELEKKDRQLKIKDEYLSLIYDIGLDYDGYDTAELLQKLIDQLVDFAKRAMKNDDKYAAYLGSKGQLFNILHEEVGEEVEE